MIICVYIQVRNKVQAALAVAKSGTWPTIESTWKDIYANNKGENEYPPFLRLPDYHKSLTFA